MDTAEFYRQLVGIEAPWRVTDVSLDLEAGEVTLLLEHGGERVACPCGRECAVHDHAEERRWRHLDTCQLKTFIRCRLPRTRCDSPVGRRCHLWKGMGPRGHRGRLPPRADGAG